MTTIAPDPAPDLLALWERGRGLPPLHRSLALAEAVGPSRDELLQQPVGSTNRILLDLREHLLGGDLTATAWCPSCGERVEFDLAREQFPDGGGPAAGEYGGVRWRAPTAGDLLAASQDPQPLAALRARCLDSTDEPSAELEALLAGADPLAEILVDVDCPACGRPFLADLDIGAYVWQEIEAAARRLLLQIDALARTYGWTEPEVLALPPVRRAAYLRMAAGGLP